MATSKEYAIGIDVGGTTTKFGIVNSKGEILDQDRIPTNEHENVEEFIDDLYAKLKEHGDWMDLGSADEQKPAKEGTVEAWGRSPSNPIGGWYGLKKGLRGRFGMYIPPLMELLGLAEVTHDPKGNRMKAI